jgi:scyllo-inositol 2-dehydrogenase (NADP+)
MKKIKTGVVAYGFSGKIFQCPFIEVHDAFELKAVVQRHGDQAKQDYPAITLLRDYQELLANEEIELIVISTPAHLHYSHALKALEAGKHVVVEKPFATTEKEALHLEALAKEKGKVIAAYQNRRFDGDFLTVQKSMSSKQLGIVLYQ